MTGDPTAPGGDDEATEDELQRSSKAFLIETDRLRELEERKAAMDPRDPERATVAMEVEDVAAGLLLKSRYQTRLVEAGAEHSRVHRSIPTILGEWRDAERHLQQARLAFERAGDEADRLRTEHRRAVERERGS